MIQTFEEYKKVMEHYCEKANEALDNNNEKECQTYCGLIDELRNAYQDFDKKWCEYLFNN